MSGSLILCGLPMSGKSTLARLAAEKHGAPFVDLDRKVEENYLLETGRGLSCREIFLLEGREAFRRREKEALNKLSPFKFMALGGGTLEEVSCLKHVHELGELIYLQESLEILWERLSSHPLPAYLDPKSPKESFYELAEKRIPVYEREAQKILNLNGRTPKSLIEEYF